MTPAAPTIRPLTTADAPAYRALRLSALKTNPESYLATYESESQKSVETMAWELRQWTQPPANGYYGLFLQSQPSGENHLVGYAQLDQIFMPKQRHIAYLYNLYIDPAHRGQGYATKLIEHLSSLARETAGVERLFITCNRHNTAAQALYQKLGFRQYALREKSVKWQGEYDDELEMVKEL